MEKIMAQSLLSHNLKAFELMRRAAAEYNKAEYKFYMSGFFKFIQEDSVFFIDDIYIIPEHRGTPVAQDMLSAFTEYMIKNNIYMYYGRVYHNAKGYDNHFIF